MALAFKSRSVRFDSTRDQRQREPGSVNFGSAVRTAEASIKGYKVKFTGADHPLHEIEVDIDDVTINGSNVTFNVDLVLRDRTGNYDDAYEGRVEVLIIADLK